MAALLRRADGAMDEARLQGGNRVEAAPEGSMAQVFEVMDDGNGKLHSDSGDSSSGGGVNTRLTRATSPREE